VATNNFVRSGGDGYKVFTKNGMDAYDFGPGVEDVVIAYLKDHGPYKPHIEGRIVAGTSLAAAMKADMKKEMKAEEKPEMKKEMKASEEVMEGEYVVKAGDSLWKIAKKHYGDATMYTKIREANGAKNIRVLKIGQKLKLPK
jgi:5'-nucleotidase/UDP-sugar diphosphatase